MSRFLAFQPLYSRPYFPLWPEKHLFVYYSDSRVCDSTEKGKRTFVVDCTWITSEFSKIVSATSWFPTKKTQNKTVITKRLWHYYTLHKNLVHITDDPDPFYGEQKSGPMWEYFTFYKNTFVISHTYSRTVVQTRQHSHIYFTQCWEIWVTRYIFSVSSGENEYHTTFHLLSCTAWWVIFMTHYPLRTTRKCVCMAFSATCLSVCLNQTPKQKLGPKISRQVDLHVCCSGHTEGIKRSYTAIFRVAYLVCISTAGTNLYFPAIVKRL